MGGSNPTEGRRKENLEWGGKRGKHEITVPFRIEKGGDVGERSVLKKNLGKLI